MLRIHRIFIITIIGLTALIASPARALETDQFTIPPRPLGDFGPALNNHLIACIAKTIETANARRAKLLHDADKAQLGFIRRRLLAQAAEISTPDYIAARLYDEIGPGLPEAAIETWAVEATSRTGYQFAIDPDHSVYGNMFQRPITLQELSPTINVYGVYLGTDKIGHFFQQGHEYYRVYREAENRGRFGAECTREAVQLGVGQERGLYGEALVGVYSNGDLATNFAGLQFYLNLTRPVEIRGRYRPSILTLTDGRWEFNSRAEPEFLKLFFSDHMNESLNVSHYIWYIRDHIRQAAGERGERWAAFYHTTYEQQVERARELTAWYGQDYGHSDVANTFTAADICFPTPAARQLAMPVTASGIGHRS